MDGRRRPEGVRAGLRRPHGAGSFADLGPGTVAISDAQAKSKGFKLGDTHHDEVPGQGHQAPGGRAVPEQPGLPGDYVVTPDTLEKGGLAPLDAMVMVTKEKGADTDAVRNGDRERSSRTCPTVTVKDPEGFAAEQKEQVNQFLYLIYGLLGLSVIIAILGVINTLSLSVIERTREIGLLRAVGVTRRQLRTMIRLESVVVAVLGGVLGTVLGVLFGATHGDRAGGGRPDRPRHPVAVAGRIPAPGGGRGSARCGAAGAPSGPTGRPEGHRRRVDQA